MKRRIIVITSILFFASSCFLSREVVVEYDYDYRGAFRDYSTYDFIEDISLDQQHPNQKQHQLLVEKYVSKRLDYMGYKSEGAKPDIYIASKIFYSKLALEGYEQPDIYQWIDNPEERMEKYDKVKYQLNEGTIYLTFIDRRKKQAIWRGYASGIFGSTDFNNDRYVNEAVKRILDNYRFIASADSLGYNGNF